MSQISDKYASPLLRWALLLEDHPQATYSYALVKGKDLPGGQAIPERFGGGHDFCLATVEFPPETGLEPAYGYKGIDVGVNLKGSQTGPVTNAEQWQQLCTKCLGRALKRCGYPDDMDELRAVLRWRNEITRLRSLAEGGPAPALGAGEPETFETALEAAGRADADTAPDRPDTDGGVIDVESEEVQPQQPEQANRKPPPEIPDPPVPPPAPPSPVLDQAIVEQHRQALNRAAAGNVQAVLKAWAAQEGISWTRPATDADARAVIDKVDDLLTSVEPE